jgi:hypothetical protein
MWAIKKCIFYGPTLKSTSRYRPLQTHGNYILKVGSTSIAKILILSGINTNTKKGRMLPGNEVGDREKTPFYCYR